MTKEELDEMDTLFIKLSDSLDASSYRIPELIQQAREALELREVLECVAQEGTIFVFRSDRGVYVCQRNDVTRERRLLAVGEGKTPLEAIQNTRKEQG